MQMILVKNCGGPESVYYAELRIYQRLSQSEAMDLTFKNFPYLQKCIDGGYVSWSTQDANQKILKTTPILNELNRYITDMAPSYYDIILGYSLILSTVN